MPNSVYVKGIPLAVHYIMGFELDDDSNDHVKWVSHDCVRAYTGVLVPAYLVFERCGRVLRCISASCKPILISIPEPLSLTPCVSSYTRNHESASLALSQFILC